MVNSLKLTRDDLNLQCKDMAIYLLGKLLVRKLDDGSILKGKIVETECYLGGEDKASHSYNGRQTPRNKPMFMAAGTSYVYITYGMYYCFNISSIEPGAAVLLRALEPVENHEIMRQLRSERRKENTKPILDKDLCNGPSKLCLAMNITKDNCNMLDLCNNDRLWLEDNEMSDNDDMKIVTTSRIGIDSAGPEWANKPLRFYILSNSCVSKRDKRAENALKT